VRKWRYGGAKPHLVSAIVSKQKFQAVMMDSAAVDWQTDNSFLAFLFVGAAVAHALMRTGSGVAKAH
jgi:hypothetical protein